MEGRRLVQFYAGGKVKAKKVKMDHTMPTEMAPAPGAPVSATADGPAMKKGGATHKKRGGKLKVTIKEKNKLAMGGPPMDPMAGRMTTGLAARAPGGTRRGMPTFGGSKQPGGGPQKASRATIPPMMGALGPIR